MDEQAVSYLYVFSRLVNSFHQINSISNVENLLAPALLKNVTEAHDKSWSEYAPVPVEVAVLQFTDPEQRIGYIETYFMQSSTLVNLIIQLVLKKERQALDFFERELKPYVLNSYQTFEPTYNPAIDGLVFKYNKISVVIRKVPSSPIISSWMTLEGHE